MNDDQIKVLVNTDTFILSLINYYFNNWLKMILKMSIVYFALPQGFPLTVTEKQADPNRGRQMTVLHMAPPVDRLEGGEFFFQVQEVNCYM